MSALLGEHWVLPDAPRVWGAWFYLVFFGSMIGFSAYRFVVERVSPTLASTYAYVNSPVALLVGWWLGNESFSANTLLGLPMVLGAVALLAWVQARAQGRAAEQGVGAAPHRLHEEGAAVLTRHHNACVRARNASAKPPCPVPGGRNGRTNARTQQRGKLIGVMVPAHRGGDRLSGYGGGVQIDLREARRQPRQSRQ